MELNTVSVDSVIFGAIGDGDNSVMIFWDDTVGFTFKYEAGTQNQKVEIAPGAIINEGDGKKHHVTMTWDKNAGSDGEMKAFIDGAQVGSTQTNFDTWAVPISDEVSIGS